MKRSHLNILTISFLALALCVVLPACQASLPSSPKISDCQNNEAGVPTNCNIGEFITFGHYEQDGNSNNGKEPINWRILDKNDKGQYLVISEKVLEPKPYNTTRIEVTWETSTIRSWLNGYGGSYNTVGNDYASDNFIDTAFTDEEKAKIIPYNITEHSDSSLPTPSDNDNATMDKIFLLSIEEAKKYFADEDDRSADATDYAIKNNIIRVTACEAMGYCHWPKYKKRTFWWLRSQDTLSKTYAAIVSNLGNFSDAIVDYNAEIEPTKPERYDGVRPAMWVQL